MINVQSHDQDQSKLGSSINANSVAYTLAYGRKPYEKIIKSPFNKKSIQNVRTTKSKQNSNNDLITMTCRIG